VLCSLAMTDGEAGVRKKGIRSRAQGLKSPLEEREAALRRLGHNPLWGAGGPLGRKGLAVHLTKPNRSNHSNHLNG
jgi:hypothetical protein